MVKESVDKKEKIKCSKCGSGFGYLKLKDKSWCCRSCGNIDKGVIR